MTIYLRRQLVERLIERDHANVDGLVDEWGRRESEREDYPHCRERATIYHWLSKGVPTPRGRGRHLIFALCGLLDTDPMALLDYEKNRFFKDFTKIRMSLYMFTERVFKSGASNFAPLIDMFMPGPSWPSAAMSELYYGRDWFATEFDNTGHEQGSNYGLIKVRFVELEGHPVRSVHIAYRRRGSNDRMWRYYGLVNLIGDCLELYTEGGEHQAMMCITNGEIWFRTSFGYRPVEFRLASLHEFTYTTEISNDMTIIGFNW